MNTAANQFSTRGRGGFTMIEIAISLAIIGFAMVAIIGILPTGMSVQRENREETIINQDATIFMNAIRNGERGLDDLTNYVVAITNFWTDYSGTAVLSSGADYYSVTNSGPTPGFPLNSGGRIVGLLSTPRILDGGNGQFRSNYVVAIFRSISGPANEKFPQGNPSVQELALTYRMLPAVIPYSVNHSYDPVWTNYTDPALFTPITNSVEIARRKTFHDVARQMEANHHEVRLIFRWPVLPRGMGNGRQVFRTLVAGPVTAQLEPRIGGGPDQPLFFFNSRTYSRVQP